jgi:hypothetical protein
MLLVDTKVEVQYETVEVQYETEVSAWKIFEFILVYYLVLINILLCNNTGINK